MIYTSMYIDDVCTMCLLFGSLRRCFGTESHLSTTASRIDGFTLVLECYCNGSSSGFGMSWWSQSIQVDECLAAPNMVDIEYQGENLFPERDVGRRANCWEVQVPTVPNKLQQWLLSARRKDGGA